MTDQAKTITIQGFEFEVLSPYAEGQTITEAEAAALNQTRAENIRNNMAKRVKELRIETVTTDEDGNEVKTYEMSDEDLLTVTAEVSEYDKAYQFTMASVGGGRKPSDPVEVEARSIAKKAITAKLREAGKLVKDVDKDKLAEAVANLAQSEKIVAEAKRVVKARNSAASADLADLGL